MPRRATMDWHAVVENTPEVKRWHRYLLGRSKDSARVYASNMIRTLHEFGGRKPTDLLKLEQEQLDEFMQDYVDFFIKQKKLAGSTVSTYADSVKSFLAWHSKTLIRPLHIPGSTENPRAESQEIPAQEGVRKLLVACDLRTSVMVALECFSGVRPQVLGRSDGSEGLQLQHFPELEILASDVRVAKTPTPIKVPKHLSKTRKAYLTWLGPEGCDYLLTYLRSRIAAGEVLKPTSPVIVPLSGEPRVMRRGNIQDCIRIRMRQVGLQSSTYIHRSYFDNRLVVAESHGVPAIYREFWMGHAGTLQVRYALRKERLPPDTLEDMRTAYEKALPYLETRLQPQANPRNDMATMMLRTAGIPAEEARKLVAEAKGDDELVALLLARAPAKQPAPVKVAPRQRIVPLSGLEKALEEGWIFRTSLPGDRAIVETAA